MIDLTEKALDPERITAKVRRDSNGAVVTFLGTTRDNFEGKTVLTLEYEAFDEMAVKKLEEVRQELMVEFGLEQIAISHRIGTVGIGEISLVIAVGSPHRKESFNACQKAVDRIKEVVPIWKKEVYQDGSRWVACEDHEFSPADQHSTESHPTRER
ncbi:MAG: molybdopterin (MPT) converting factor, subunit 2 [Chloroflexi bacterium]|jgi:molybdopterin synthase catalytic subunit|nr:molybdopterin (MPT) converting factor, subunit 2 [Chloroflexota bacterium]MDP6497554.1 molybdenum cofactor biosynthesis protein MoaE [Dehalococcoidia bacterium]MQG54662.1 molybdenum cofactor biosynthesis protein MoaE [SAR202 cluster bacterium]|tara:strand:+ start:481 stop:948 length:468 start_codon:yes stop_codon:yes gene_type:complete